MDGQRRTYVGIVAAECIMMMQAIIALAAIVINQKFARMFVRVAYC